MANYDYINTTSRIKVVLLRTPMVAPKMSHAFSICPPLGLAYLGAALQKADFEVTSIDALGEAPLQKIISENNNNFINVGLSTKQILQFPAIDNFS